MHTGVLKTSAGSVSHPAHSCEGLDTLRSRLCQFGEVFACDLPGVATAHPDGGKTSAPGAVAVELIITANHDGGIAIEAPSFRLRRLSGLSPGGRNPESWCDCRRRRLRPH